MALGTEVGLSPGDFVVDGDPAHSIAIVGVVLNAPVIHKQASRCTCSNCCPAVLSSTLGHHTTAAYVSEGLIMAVYIHRVTLGVKPQVLPTDFLN